MPRRSRRSSPKPPPRPSKELEAAEGRPKGKPPPVIQQPNSILADLEQGIIKNWRLPESNINTCVPPELWPYNEPDPEKWHIDIVHLLHEASTINLEKKGAIPCSNNEHFRSAMSHEIHLRQLRNKSAQGKKSWMTGTDLKKVIKHLHAMAKDEKDARAKGLDKSDKNREQTPNVRRGRSKANDTTASHDAPNEANGNNTIQPEKARPITRGRGRPGKASGNEQEATRPGTKRQASDLPIRPRRVRGVKSPKVQKAAPPPVTPANPPERSDDEEEEDDQENEPLEPVSGRHIYGDFIKPTTVDFNTGVGTEAPAQLKTRQTRKRGRADNEKPPTEAQIDSDPRDIDATGFLSELDPKEARRRRKPRLSRLEQEPVAEPAWSQDVAVPPETPLFTPATDAPISGTPAAPLAAGANGVSSPSDAPASARKQSQLDIELLLELLPGIPDNATADERSRLQDRVSMIHEDIMRYRSEVWEIKERGKH